MDDDSDQQQPQHPNEEEPSTTTTTTSASSDGHSLGGSGSGTEPLTPDEVRRRRLAALERFTTKPTSSSTTTPKQNTRTKTKTPIQSNKPKKTSDDTLKITAPSENSTLTSPPMRETSSAIPTPYPSPMETSVPSASANKPAVITNTEEKINNHHDYDHDHDDPMEEYDEDAALRAALALSMADAPSVASTVKEFDSDDEHDDDDDEETQLAAALRMSMGSADNRDALSAAAATTTNTTPQTPVMSSSDQWSERVRHIVETTVKPCNILDFHCIMWDASITTKNDQERWLAQGIQFKVDDSPVPEARDSLMASIISNHSWGLTQAHGGPCGVLAAVQAELLRLLLFGPRRIDADHAAQLYSIDFPSSLSNKLVLDKPDLSPTLLRQALALSIGMILARASLKASATLHDDQAELQQQQQQQSAQQQQQHHQSFPEYYGKDPRTCIAVPIQSMGNGLEWKHLEPWSSDSGIGLSEHLVTYEISLPADPQGLSTKRPKLSNIMNPTAMATAEESIAMELARHTARFLLETNLLEWFQQPGGVLLFVTSLALSRGIPNVQGDMDDFTAKLTSNFGHCSQELINLLLTGQAVSNVFDHTLRPSGELICRGIQSRPDIGYLSALEAMRYLEVGGYYKTPRFPIWVVGSTSHFTVMFGDAACLKESASDVLLEKVRRAFKRMEGGAEENGFIQSHQLGQFMKSLDLHLPDHSIHALAASMEVHGAGIILWEDLWKRTSRLLSGASLEAVLNSSTDGSSNEPAPTTTSSTTEQLSDEELARRLQAEWNGEPTVSP
eukprot:scaffold24231_cov132-Cylindrotheca_fusiformis.AAC.1